MQVQALVKGAAAYLFFLVRTLLFPFIWVWAIAVARRHSDTDSKAVPKVVGALVAGVVLTAISFLALNGFADDAVDGMYGQLDNRLSEAVGESAYQEQVEIGLATAGQIEKLEERRENEPENRDEIDAALGVARRAHANATMYSQELEANHALYLEVTTLVGAQDDAGVKAIIAGRTADPNVPETVFSKDKVDSRTAKAFRIKDNAQGDLGLWMNYLLLPGLVGVFFAPLSFALGNVLRNAWEASDSVGFKPYPGGAMGFFLLFGAFGIPALFFAAWTFWDMDVRSVEGQISL